MKYYSLKIMKKINYKDFIFFQLLGKGSFGEVYLVEKAGLIPKK